MFKIIRAKGNGMMGFVQVGLAPDEAVQRIAQASVDGRLVLFVGAGVSRNAGLPGWKELLDPAAQKLGGWADWVGQPLPMLAQAFEEAASRRALVEIVISQLKNFRQPSDVHRLLPGLRPKQIFTTNYDRLLESTFPEAHPIASPGNLALAGDGKLAIFYMHGHVDHLGADNDGLVITDTDYRRVASVKRAFFERMKLHWQDSLILFLGYGAGDEDLKAQADAVRDTFGAAHAQRHLAIDVSDRANGTLLRALWSPLQADVVVGSDLPGATPAERLEILLRRCAEAIIKEEGEVERARLQRVQGNTGIVAEISAAVERRMDLQWPFQPPLNLPPDLPDFTGRESLIAQLEERLCSDDENDTGIWGVHGMGGVGKSALAERVSNRLYRRKAFADGYLWIKVAERSLVEVLVECWHAIGGPENIAEGMPLDALKTTLRRVWHGRRMLIVLDNCDRAERIPELLQAFNGHKLLITTRVPSERVGWFPVDCLNVNDSLALLRAICSRLGAVPDDDLGALAITKLGGLPLALRLAGTWLQFSSRRTVAEYLKLLHDEGLKRLHGPVSGMAGLDEGRTRDVRACFGLSVNALTQGQRQVFKLLAMAGCDLPINVAHHWLRYVNKAWTVRDCDDAIDALIAAALLETGGDQRLKVHALLRDYGRELTREEPMSDIDAGTFAQVLLETAETAPPGVNGLPWACNEATLIDDAIQCAWADGATQAALRLLALVAGWSWVAHGPLLPIRRLARLILSDASRLSDEQCLKVLMISGDVLCRLNEYAEAVEDIKVAQTLARALGDDGCVIRCLYLLRRQPPGEWLPTLRSVIRMARSKRLRLHSEIQPLTSHLLERVGGDPTGLARLAVERHFQTPDSVFNCLIELYAIVSHNDGLLVAEKAALCSGLVNWACRCHFPEIYFLLRVEEAWCSLRAGNISAAGDVLERLRNDPLLGRYSDVILRGDLDLAFACLAVWRGDKASLLEARRLLVGLNSGAVSLNRMGELHRALLACEVDLGLALVEECGAILKRLDALVEQARSEMMIDALLWGELLQCVAYWRNRQGEIRGEGQAQAIWSRVSASVAQYSSVDRSHIDRVMGRLGEAGFKAVASFENVVHYDLRPSWWANADSLPSRIVLADGTPMVLLPPACYAIAHTELRDPYTAQCPAHVPVDVWESWLELARKLPPPSMWLPGFYIDIHPVTWGQYVAYCQSTDTVPPIEIPESKFWNRPVTGLTHEEANAYALWAGKQLPIADEWCAALCGEVGRRYPWGDEIGNVNVEVSPSMSLSLPDMSVHPLSTFDELRFAELLRGSLSLSVSEKLRVACAVPTLSQFQVDELFKVLEDELVEFNKLEPTEGEQIERQRRNRDAAMFFASGLAPRDVMSIHGDATPEGVRDLVGCVREWVADSVVKQGGGEGYKVMGLLPNNKLLADFDVAALPEFIGQLHQTQFRQADATVGFRCVIPLVDGVALPPVLQQGYGPRSLAK